MEVRLRTGVPKSFLCLISSLFHHYLKPFQVLWWNWAFKSLLNLPKPTLQKYQNVASEKAISFWQQPQMKAYRKP